MKNLGEQIYFYRRKCGLSQLDIAEKLDVSRQSVSKWENDVATPELDKLVLLSEIFGITLDELVHGTKTSGETIEKTSPAKVENNLIRQIFAAIFMVLSLISFFFYDPHISFFLFTPLFITGILLIKRPSRTGMFLMWTWFLSLDAFFLQVGTPFRQGIILFLYFFLLIPLIIITVASFRNQKFDFSRKARIFLAIGVPLMPALGAFSRAFLLKITLLDKIFPIRFPLRDFLAEVVLVDIFLAAFLICLVPTFYATVERIRKKHNHKNFD